MGLKNRFSGDDSYVLTAQIATSNNNQATFNATVAENDHLRGTSVSISSQAIIRQPGTPFPQVANAVENTVGAALGGVGQTGTYSEEEGGGGVPCFISGTEITMPYGGRGIENIHPLDIVTSFDKEGNRVPKRVTDKFEHLVEEYTLITFADGRKTGLIEDHRYWTRQDFQPIRELESVWNWNGQWNRVSIVSRAIIKERVVVYNFTVEDLHCYFANGDAVSNLKPDPDRGGGVT